MTDFWNSVWSTTLAVLLAGVASTAQAGTLSGSRVAWGYVTPANNGACSTCFTNSPKGDTVYITPLGVGAYEIAVEGLYLPESSDLQVTSADTEQAYCATSGWSHGANKGILAYVNCYDISGNPTESGFAFLYQSRSLPFGSAVKGIAFLWADQPTEASYTPNLSYQYNSTGATNTMTRNGTGSYTALIPGLTKTGGNVQVTAYGSGPARCKLASWSAGQSGTSVSVLCFDATGAAADEMFTLMYTIGEPPGLFPVRYAGFGHTGAYVWANKPKNINVYTPPHAYNYNGFKTGPLTVQRNATGVYTLAVPEKTDFGIASMLVTAYGPTNSFCVAIDGANEWNPAQVFCYDQQGNPTDSAFTATLQTDLND